jgi:hypothetical protein
MPGKPTKPGPKPLTPPAKPPMKPGKPPVKPLKGPEDFPEPAGGPQIGKKQ